MAAASRAAQASRAHGMEVVHVAVVCEQPDAVTIDGTATVAALLARVVATLDSTVLRLAVCRPAVRDG